MTALAVVVSVVVEGAGCVVGGGTTGRVKTVGRVRGAGIRSGGACCANALTGMMAHRKRQSVNILDLETLCLNILSSIIKLVGK